MLPALALLAAMAAGRAAYPRLVERRQRARRRMGPDGLIVGSAPITLRREGATGVLLIHGGGDTPQVLAGLAGHLHAHGFSVHVPLLEAHGRGLRAMMDASASVWHDQVRHELDALAHAHPSIAVVGLSMGGALAVRAAAERSDLTSLVLLAPYIAMPAVLRRLADSTEWWGWLLPYFSSFGSRSIRDPEAAQRALGHGILTPAMLRALRDVVDSAWAALPLVAAPTLVMQSREDNRIAAHSAELGFARLGAAEKKFVWTNGAGHVITVDFGFQRVYDMTRGWLEAHRSATTRRSGRALRDSR